MGSNSRTAHGSRKLTSSFEGPPTTPPETAGFNFGVKWPGCVGGGCAKIRSVVGIYSSGIVRNAFC
jgi:hypothetical protein